MSATKTARQEVIDTLTAAGFRVFDHPLKVGQNTIAIQSVDPQLEYVPNLHGDWLFRYSLQVHCVGGNPGVENAIEPLEDMVEKAISVLGDWDIAPVPSARPADIGDGKVALVTTLTISTQIHITGGQ